MTFDEGPVGSKHHFAFLKGDGLQEQCYGIFFSQDVNEHKYVKSIEEEVEEQEGFY